MTPDIQELKRLAEAADGVSGHSYESHKALARYSAAASPSTILALIEIAEAAEVYYTRYAQDEASDDGVEMIGCGQQQHEDAKRLRTALEGVKK